MFKNWGDRRRKFGRVARVYLGLLLITAVLAWIELPTLLALCGGARDVGLPHHHLITIWMAVGACGVALASIYLLAIDLGKAHKDLFGPR